MQVPLPPPPTLPLLPYCCDYPRVIFMQFCQQSSTEWGWHDTPLSPQDHSSLYYQLMTSDEVRLQTGISWLLGQSIQSHWPYPGKKGIFTGLFCDVLSSDWPLILESNVEGCLVPPPPPSPQPAPSVCFLVCFLFVLFLMLFYVLFSCCHCCLFCFVSEDNKYTIHDNWSCWLLSKSLWSL